MRRSPGLHRALRRANVGADRLEGGGVVNEREHLAEPVQLRTAIAELVHELHRAMHGPPHLDAAPVQTPAGGDDASDTDQ
jgi:hypothetical protein